MNGDEMGVDTRGIQHKNFVKHHHLHISFPPCIACPCRPIENVISYVEAFISFSSLVLLKFACLFYLLFSVCSVLLYFLDGPSTMDIWMDGCT
jgi:hypothetical protein